MKIDISANDPKPRVSFDQLDLDDAGRVLSLCDELTDEQLALVAGGGKRICRIQTSTEGCGMNM
jgi:hypothetical protein